jgi:carboxylesterase type B
MENASDYITALGGYVKDGGLIPNPVNGSYYLAIRQLIKLSAFAASSKEFVDQIVNYSALSKKHYAYNFDYRFDYPAEYPTKTGAAHTAELAFVFGNMMHDNVKAIDMSNQVMEYWTNFAKTGNPNSDGLVE